MATPTPPPASPPQSPPGGPAPDRSGLLGTPVVLALLGAMGCHALVLDADLRVLAYDVGAPAALGLRTGPGGLDILPALARTTFASRGFRLCGAPIPLDPPGHHLWVFKDVRSLEHREELEMIFLHELLTALALGRATGPEGGETNRLKAMWDLALDLYREVVLPKVGAAAGCGREAPGSRLLEAEEAPEGSDAAEVPAPGAEARAGDPTVLVVDDSSMVRRLLGAVLGKAYGVLAAADGAQAIALALEHRPDLVLLDAVMPGLDGFAVCERLKEDPRTREIPVLFLTALQGEVDEVRALEAGAIDFIQKPINAATVLARVRNHIDLKHSKEKLVQLAVTDSLTRLANRRHFDEVLTVEWHRSRREGQPLSLIMADVDSFKRYNDAYGHPAGDACLAAVGRVLKAALRRPADLAARYGGEEFTCLLPETDEAGALALAETISAALAKLGLPHAHSEVAPHVTLSLGVATAYPAAQDGQAALVEEADRRMYEAKRRAKARGIPPEAADKP